MSTPQEESSDLKVPQEPVTEGNDIYGFLVPDVGYIKPREYWDDIGDCV